MPRGTERSLTYVRERDAQGHLVIRAVARDLVASASASEAETASAKDPRGPGR